MEIVCWHSQMCRSTCWFCLFVYFTVHTTPNGTNLKSVARFRLYNIKLELQLSWWFSKCIKCYTVYNVGKMSRLMTKPTKWLCVQRRLGSAWASTQSDQSSVSAWRNWVLSYPLSAQRRRWSDWVDAQAGLSLRWAHSHFIGFVMRRLKCLAYLIQPSAKDTAYN